MLIRSNKTVSSNNKLKIAVLAGGVGAERDVSIRSGKCVAEALTQAGFDVETADVKPDDTGVLDDSGIDVFFVAMHGEFGEDGKLQQILDDKGLVYTGSGAKACQLAFDKLASEKAFIQAGVRVPSAIDFCAESDMPGLEEQIEALADKYVVKPVRQGSSIGVTIVNDRRKVLDAARQCYEQFGDCMIQEFVPGREVTVGILCGRVLPIIELRTQEGVYDYHAKYKDDATEFLFDTIDDSALIEKINAAAMDCFNALGCRHFARVDFRLSDDGVAYALELNAIPGFTDRSDLPKAAAKTGLSMTGLCTEIVEAAMENKTAQQISC